MNFTILKNLQKFILPRSYHTISPRSCHILHTMSLPYPSDHYPIMSISPLFYHILNTMILPYHTHHVRTSSIILCSYYNHVTLILPYPSYHHPTVSFFCHDITMPSRPLYYHIHLTPQTNHSSYKDPTIPSHHDSTISYFTIFH